MSRLTRLARAASAYGQRRAATASDAPRSLPGLLGQLAGFFRGRNTSQRRGVPQPPGDMETLPGAPPQGPPRIPPVTNWRRPPDDDEPPDGPTGNAPLGGDDDGDQQRQFDDITIFGRDKSFDTDDWQEVHARLRLVDSSNVYGYYFQPESRTMGILYVQFLDYTPKAAGGSGERGGPGPTYAYYDVPIAKYRQFEAMADDSAGGAVWDYCRVRGSKFEHQHTYRLIQTAGEYVPRKATAGGYKRRNTAQIGIGQRQRKQNQGGGARVQLPQQSIAFRRVLPNGQPYRGLPNRGEPNRGR